jgi:hypothetical protein
MYEMLLDLRKNPIVKTCYAFGDALHITLEKGEGRKQKAESIQNSILNLIQDKIQNYLTSLNHNNVTVKEIAPNIEDCYMKLAQNGSD